MSTTAATRGDGPVANTDILPEVHELFRGRWSPRAFSDRPVSDRDLAVILDAARWAPSSFNEQPWRFVVARKSDGPAYERLLGILLPFNQVWAKAAPVLIISAVKRTFSHNGQANSHAMHDAGAALGYLALQATALGLHTHAMAGFDREKARQELQIPEDFDLVAAVALGYAGDPSQLSDQLRERETALRQRKPLSEIVFDGRWNEPLTLR